MIGRWRMPRHAGVALAERTGTLAAAVHAILGVP